MTASVLGCYEASSEEANAGDVESGECAGNGSLEVLGEASIVVEPSEGSLDDPSARQLSVPRIASGHRRDEGRRELVTS